MSRTIRISSGAVSVTAGAQFMNKEDGGYDNTIRYIGNLSYTF